MIYGMYRSAGGIMTSAHRQDVISNNLANVETAGFRKNLATFMQRPMAYDEIPGGRAYHNRFYDNLGGGTFVLPTLTDFSQGEIEQTSSPTDISLVGKGFLTVERDGKKYLTRSGKMMQNSDGELVLSSDQSIKVLDDQLNPISITPQQLLELSFTARGELVNGTTVLAKLGIRDLPQGARPQKVGSLLMDAGDVSVLPESQGTQVVQYYAERSNVSAPAELAALIESQRALEANANMIRYQDATLARLVNDVGRIS